MTRCGSIPLMIARMAGRQNPPSGSHSPITGVGGGLLTKPEEQPHAEGKSDTCSGAFSMGDASMPALRGVDPARDFVPVSRDG